MAVDPDLLVKREQAFARLQKCGVGQAADFLAAELVRLDKLIAKEREDEAHERERARRQRQEEQWRAEKVPDAEYRKLITQLKENVERRKAAGA